MLKFKLHIFYILTLIVFLSTNLQSHSSEEYSFDELLGFHKFGIGVNASFISPQKDFIRKNYSLTDPFFNLNLNFNQRLTSFLYSELNLSYYALKTESFDTVRLAVPEASVVFYFNKSIYGNIYLELGAGGGFSSALSSSKITTVNPNKIIIGNSQTTKAKYGYNLIGAVNLRKYFDEYSSVILSFKYSYSQIGNPKTNGLGNLGGFRFGIGYNFNF